MVFFKSNFLFIYNVPSSASAEGVLFDTSIKEFLFMPEIRDNSRCGFAYNDVTMYTEDVDIDSRTAEIITNIKRFGLNNLIDCDEVWLCSAFNEQPPLPSLVKTNFVFIYNIPQSGVNLQHLTNLTRSKNLIMLPGIDGVSRCAFVELPAMSDKNWEHLLGGLREKVYYNRKLEVDEVYVNMTPPVTEPTLMERQMFMQKRNQAVKRSNVVANQYNQPQTQQRQPQQQHQREYAKSAMAAKSDTSAARDKPATILKSSQESGVASTSSAGDDQQPESSELKNMLSSMSDSEIDELVDRIKSNFDDLHKQAEEGGTDVAQLLANVKEIVAEQNVRKTKRDAEKSLKEIKDLLKPKKVEQSKAEELTSNLLGFLKPSPMKSESGKGESSNVQGRSRAYDRMLSRSEPNEDMDISPAPKRVSMGVGEDYPPAKKQAVAPDLNSADLVRSFFLFIYDIPPEVTLKALLDDVPHIDNFVFMDVMEQHNKCGFAYVKTHHSDAREQAIAALCKKRFGPENRTLRVDEVYLHPKTVSPHKSEPHPVAAVNKTNYGLPESFLESVNKISSLLQQQGQQQPMGIPPPPVGNPLAHFPQGHPMMTAPNRPGLLGQYVPPPNMMGPNMGPPPNLGRPSGFLSAGNMGPFNPGMGPSGIFPAGQPTVKQSGVRMTISQQMKPQTLKPAVVAYSDEENIFGVSEDAENYMRSSGNNDETHPVFYCVEVTGLPDRFYIGDLENLLISRLKRENDWFLIQDMKKEKDQKFRSHSQRAIFFGGSINQADRLRMEITPKLLDEFRSVEVRVTAANLPESLAPLPLEVVELVHPRRIILYNFPKLPLDLVLSLIGRFVPSANSYYCPASSKDDKVTFGYIYLGYKFFRDCKRDYERLKDWKVAGARQGVKIHYVVDTGYGREGPIGIARRGGEAPPKPVTYLEIAHVRSRSNRFQVPADDQDYLAEYRPLSSGAAIAPDLHNALERNAYDGRSESLYAIRLHGVGKDASTTDIRRYLTTCMDGLCDLMEKEPNWGEMVLINCAVTGGRVSNEKYNKEVLVSFTKHGALDTACSILRDKLVRQDDTLKRAFGGFLPDYERHKQDAFIPVTSAWAERRGCQHLFFSELPRSTRDDALNMLRELAPGARSWYIPCQGPSAIGSDIISGHAVARFDDPRDARQNFRSLAPICHLGVSRFEIRVCFAALHKTLSSGSYGNMQMPLHNVYPWLRYDMKLKKWLADAGQRQSFYCPCHVDCLPFKPLSVKGPKGFR